MDKFKIKREAGDFGRNNDKEFAMNGMRTEGFADGGEVMDQDVPSVPQHADEAEDADMIKSVLQKIIDEMDGLEANRIHPKMAMQMDITKAPEGSPEEEKGEDPSMEQDEADLDPEILSKLMDKAGTADDSGELPEDKSAGLPDSVMAAVNKKKKGFLGQ